MTNCSPKFAFLHTNTHLEFTPIEDDKLFKQLFMILK